MIRRKHGGGWLLFTQDDHARLSAEIMSLWGGRFFFPDPPDELLFAISEHDCGWKETDASPSLNPRGEPEDFTEISPPRQTEIWRRSFEKHAGANPWAAALIALHFNKFNERVLSRKPNKWSLALKDEIENLVKKTLGVSSVSRLCAQTQKNLKLLRTGDAISLALCHGWETFEVGQVSLEKSGETTVRLQMTGENAFGISPWPFARDESLSFETAFRRTRAEKFATSGELIAEMKTAEREKITFTLSPEKMK